MIRKPAAAWTPYKGEHVEGQAAVFFSGHKHPNSSSPLPQKDGWKRV